MPDAVTVTEALLNSLWQGTVLALLAPALARAGGRSASARYAIWYAAACLILFLPLAQVAGRAARSAGAPPAAAAFHEGPAMPVEAPLRLDAPEPRPRIPLPVEIPAEEAARLAAFAWAAVALFLGFRLAAAYRRLVAIKRSSEPVSGRARYWWSRWRALAPSHRVPELRTSRLVRLPMTAGLRRPAIVFPEGLLERLSEPDARRIWLHELAHVRRLDDWGKLGQKLIEALLFFHPAVRWIGARLDFERELACDEWVVSETGSARPYAACLARLAEYASVAAVPPAAPAMAAGRKQILRRVEMLIANKYKREQPESRAFGVIAAAALLAAGLLLAAAGPAFVVPAAAQEAPAVEQPPPPAPPAPPAPEAVPAPAPPPAKTTGQAPPAPPAPPVRPAPPAPPARPAPAPAPAPEPAVPAHRELEAKMRQLQEEMRPYRDEMRELARQMREEVERNVRANTDEIRRLAGEIRDTVQASLQPTMQEIRRLQEEIGRERSQANADESKIRSLEDQIRQLESGTMRLAEERIRESERQIREYESRFHPSEDVMRRIEEKMRLIEQQIEQKAREMKDLEIRLRRADPI